MGSNPISSSKRIGFSVVETKTKQNKKNNEKKNENVLGIKERFKTN